MKILALMTDAFGGYGGIAQYNRDLLRALSSLDSVSQITVLTRGGEAAGIQLPPKIRQRNGRRSRGLYALSCLSAAIRLRPDWIFCGHLYMVPLAALAARLTQARLWLQIHGIEAWEEPNKFVQRAAARADLVTAVSRYSYSRFLQWADTPADRVRVLPNTVGAQFTPDAGSRARLGYAGRKLLLTVSRLAPEERYKGHDRVIPLIPALLKEHPNLLYLIAGEGPDRGRLETLVRQQGVSGAVQFLGKVDDTHLLDLYRAAHVFVMPSSKEGFGIVFLEAAACGARVVGGNADGSVDALAEGEIGILINPHDPGALLKALLKALACDDAAEPSRVDRFRSNNFNTHLQSLFSIAAPTPAPNLP